MATADGAGAVRTSDPSWTTEQLDAITRRDGDLMLAAGAGSGKTSVLVERFARSVLEDGIPVGAILTITFTDKAAGELRERIRARLRELGAPAAARETERAFISTIHGFCARLLRAEALLAGLDPQFSVLDEAATQRLSARALDDALEALAQSGEEGLELLATYGAGRLRAATAWLHGELRARGQREPRLPELPPLPPMAALALELREAAEELASELGTIGQPGAQVLSACERAQRCHELAGRHPWPDELVAVGLPGGNGAALRTAAAERYTETLAAYRQACGHLHARRVLRLLDRLLQEFSTRFESAKRAVSGLDFDDLELTARDLLADHPELRDGYRERFARIMVDELQDTNALQLELIGQLARGNLFTVGDAQQSIYGFRHADVELFEARARELEAAGRCATLVRNFRSRPELLEVLNAAFDHELGDDFTPLEAGRALAAAPGGAAAESSSPVELLLADKAGEWSAEGLAAPWRLAEARALATRVRQLLDAGAAARDVVVLMRATTDMRAYERALEDQGIPTYMIGGRGYWSHPQVLDVLAYLRALANPREEAALYGVLASPLVGVCLDGLVLLAATAREQGRHPWWALQEGIPDGVSPADRERFARFVGWFGAERAGAPRRGVEELIGRLLERTGYDLGVLAMPGGRRRLANIRKLMRLAREHEAVNGRDLRGFLELARARAAGRVGDSRESEAPVEGEGLGAVRLMTIHRAKGLEFEIVCVADLGRDPPARGEFVRLGRDGRFGLRLLRPGGGAVSPVLDHDALRAEQLEREAREERRLFYVAMTRARERLILSGAARLTEHEAVEAEAPTGRRLPLDSERSPTGWIVRAMTQAGIAPRYVDPEEVGTLGPSSAGRRMVAPGPVQTEADAGLARRVAAPHLSTLSYSSLGEFHRCGYRFYVERVLGIPAVDRERGADATGPASGSLLAAERGIAVHALLERIDFRRPRVPDGTHPEVARLARAFAGSKTCGRLAAATEVRREERFSFVLPGGITITGVLDVLAREREGGVLVVDYKSDRLNGLAPSAIVEAAYSVQRLIYALAVLRGGAEAVEVAHVFLERAQEPASARFSASDAPRLEAELAGLAAAAAAGRFEVAPDPHRGLCGGCPAEGGLCSWPLELTRREEPAMTRREEPARTRREEPEVASREEPETAPSPEPGRLF